MKSNQVNTEQLSFELISGAGDARSDAMQAIQMARAKEPIGKIEELLKTAREKLTATHKTHASIINVEATGKDLQINLLFLHAQDHFMNAMTVVDLADFIVDLYRNNEKKAK